MANNNDQDNKSPQGGSTSGGQNNKIKKLEYLFDRFSEFGFLDQSDEESVKGLKDLDVFKKVVEFILLKDIFVEEKTALLSSEIVKLFDKEKEYIGLIKEYKKLNQELPIYTYYQELVDKVLEKKYYPQTYKEILVRRDGFYSELKDKFENHQDSLVFEPEFFVSREDDSFLITAIYKEKVVRRYLVEDHKPPEELKKSLENKDVLEQLSSEQKEEVVNQRSYFMIIQDAAGKVVGHRTLIIDPSKEERVNTYRASGEIEIENDNEKAMYCLEVATAEVLQQYSQQLSKKIVWSTHDNQAMDYFNFGRAYEESGGNAKWLEAFKERLCKDKLRIWLQFYVNRFDFEIDGVRLFKPESKSKIEKYNELEKIFFRVEGEKGYTIDEKVIKNKFGDKALREKNLEKVERILEQMAGFIQ